MTPHNGSIAILPRVVGAPGETHLSGSGGMNVGPGDAIRSALGLLLPCWFYPVGLITGVAAATGHWSHALNTDAAIVGFACAAGVEALRRVVLVTKPDRGVSATAMLRAVIVGVMVLSLPVVVLLLANLVTGCFGYVCGQDATIAVGLWFGVCALCLLTTPLALSLLRRSQWLQLR